VRGGTVAATGGLGIWPGHRRGVGRAYDTSHAVRERAGDR
jgi:hypothetical protein